MITILFVVIRSLEELLRTIDNWLRNNFHDYVKNVYYLQML